MPLALDDPHWNELEGSYGNTADIVTWLSEAYEQGGFEGERLGDLINEVQHQGDTTSAMYAVAPHLIALARVSTPPNALSMLTHAGMIYADAHRPRAVSCPTFLQAEFTSFAVEGARILSPLIPTEAKDFDGFKWAVVALAGFMGQNAFARLLSGFDSHQGKFYHSALDEPFPEEET